ncbi:hypothetical protein ACFFNY_35315 [Paenibacillus hodogayensis]|uniref:Neutral/alkaline non-lysosomal ceramidase N-terminal domain-containing protein n=1 Tax=Paenibacillus hodogayensis TaxID=279208 RepID=A0ABV5W901_9BACL
MDTNVLLGTAKMDITPTFPAELQPAHPLRQDAASESVRRLYARVAVFQYTSKRSRPQYAVVVSADIIYFVDQRIDSLRKQLLEQWGIPGEAIVFQGTHTHSAPCPGSRFGEAFDGPYRTFIELLETSIVQGVERAIANLEPVAAERGSGSCGFATNRRKREDGKIVMAPCDEGPTDPEVTVIRFRKRDGREKCVFIHYACHPTTTYDNAFSSEFPGVAVEQVEAALGHDATVFYLQGCCGDIRPAVVRDGRYYAGSNLEVSRYGCELAATVLGVLVSRMEPLRFVPFECRSAQVRLPFLSQPSADELEKHRDKSDGLGTWSRMLLDHPDRNVPYELLWIGYIRLADGLAFLAMNGEVVVEYGLYTKRVFGGKVLPMGYSNGHTTYIPTAAQLKEGGFEAHDVFYASGRPSPYDLSIEQAIKEAIVRLVQQ